MSWPTTKRPEDFLAIAANLRGEKQVSRAQAFEWLVAKVREYDLALQSLTPGGSEFVSDPDRCVEFVKQVRQADFGIIKRDKATLVRLRSALEAEAASHDLLAPLNPLLTKYHREHAAVLRGALDGKTEDSDDR
jgi:hypothetical protein